MADQPSLARSLLIRGIVNPLAPIRLLGGGDSRFADGRQGTSPFNTGYTLHRYSALNLAVWGMRGRVIHDARTDLFATAGFTSATWITNHMPACVAACQAAVTAGQQPVVAMHLLTNDFFGSVSQAVMKANVETIAAALRDAGAVVLWLLENPRSGANVLSAANERNRLAMNDYLVARANPWFRPVNYLAGFTADGSYTGATATSGLQRDDLHDAQRGAAIKARALMAVLSMLPQVASALSYAAPAAPYHATDNPNGNRLANGSMVGGTTTPTGWTGSVRNAADSAAASSLTAAFSPIRDDDGTPWSRMTLGGTGGGSEIAYLNQLPNPLNFTAGDVVAGRVRVRWAGLAGVKHIALRPAFYGTTFFGHIIGSQGSGIMPAAGEEVLPFVAIAPAGVTFGDFRCLVEANGTDAVAGTVDWTAAEWTEVA